MIAFHHADAGYGSKPVLKNVGVRFDRGKISVVIGPNGCGKSTLLKTAAGLLRPTAGEITVDGKDLLRMPHKKLAALVSYLPQSRSSVSLPVIDLVMQGRFPYLGFPRRPSKEDEEAVQEAMRMAGVSKLQDRNLETLSGGERQRAYLAMAIAQDTEAILWDEPATYMDIGHQFEILSIMRNLRDQNRAVVAVMHDLSQAFSVADRICLMERGTIRAFGPADEVYNSKAADRVFAVSSKKLSADDGKDLIFFTPHCAVR